MQRLQQTVFQNISKDTQYQSSTKRINQKHEMFPKYRDVEIRNEFEIVDLHDEGELTKGDIIAYLEDKYQWINMDVLNSVLSTMDWNYDKKTVSKEEFTEKYLDYEKRLYREIYDLKFHNNWVETLQNIFDNETNGGKVSPRVYFYVQLVDVNVLHEDHYLHWMDVKFIYENHEKKVDYEIWEGCHEAKTPSFEVWLPSQKDEFFLKFVLLDTRDNDYIYGQGHLCIPLRQKIERKNRVEVQVKKRGRNVGSCTLVYRAETSIHTVQKQLEHLRKQGDSYTYLLEEKKKQYEYLQFLWGVRHRAPHQVSELDVKWMLIFRAVALVVLGLLGLVVQIYGRCQPLCLIIAFLMLKNYNLVLLRDEKFMITQLVLASIMLDIIWLIFISDTPSQINFIDMQAAKIVTFLLLATKAFFFLYMLVMQKSFVSEKQWSN